MHIRVSSWVLHNVYHHVQWVVHINWDVSSSVPYCNTVCYQRRPFWIYICFYLEPSATPIPTVVTPEPSTTPGPEETPSVASAPGEHRTTVHIWVHRMHTNLSLNSVYTQTRCIKTWLVILQLSPSVDGFAYFNTLPCMQCTYTTADNLCDVFVWILAGMPHSPGLPKTL